MPRGWRGDAGRCRDPPRSRVPSTGLPPVEERKLFGDCGGFGKLGLVSSCWPGGRSLGGPFPAQSRNSGSELRPCGAHTETGTGAILNPAVLAAQMKTQRSGARAWQTKGGQLPGLRAQDGGPDISLFWDCGQLARPSDRGCVSLGNFSRLRRLGNLVPPLGGSKVAYRVG